MLGSFMQSLLILTGIRDRHQILELLESAHHLGTPESSSPAQPQRSPLAAPVITSGATAI
jgi:hypothetical protein